MTSEHSELPLELRAATGSPAAVVHRTAIVHKGWAR